MKKVCKILSVGLWCLFPLLVQANGLEKGDQMVSGFFGGSLSVSGSAIDIETSWGNAEGVDWAEGALSYGVQYLYVLNPYLALGAEFNANNFESSSDTVWGYGYEETIHSKMDVYSLMIAGRLTTNPGSGFRFYIPFGGGWAIAKNSVSATINGVSGSGSDTDNSFIYYVGMGLEGDVSVNWLVGLELRYSSFPFDTSKLVKGGGNEDYSFLSFMLKLAYKF